MRHRFAVVDHHHRTRSSVRQNLDDPIDVPGSGFRLNRVHHDVAKQRGAGRAGGLQV